MTLGTFELAESPTFGVYLKSMTSGLATSQYLAEPLFIGSVYSVADETTEDFSSASGEWDIQIETVDVTTTITAEFVDDPFAKIEIDIVRIENGIKIGNIRMTSSADFVVSAVQIRSMFEPSSIGATGDTLFAANNSTTGYTQYQPHTSGSAVLNTRGSCQFISFWNSETQLHQYMYYDDVQETAVVFGYQGFGAYLVWNFSVQSDRFYEPSFNCTRNFYLHILHKQSNHPHPELASQAAAHWYKEWADANGPWSTVGDWHNAADVSPHVKLCRLNITGTTFEPDRIQNEIENWIALGIDKGFIHDYGWMNNDNHVSGYERYPDMMWPEPTHAGAIPAERITLISELNDLGFKVCPYVYGRSFSSLAGASWRHDDYASGAGTISLSALGAFINDKDGAVKVFASGGAYVGEFGAESLRLIDFGNDAALPAQAAWTQLEFLSRDLVARWLAATAPRAFHFLYIDALGENLYLPTPAAADPAVGATMMSDDPPSAGWSHAKFNEGQRRWMIAAKAQLAIASSDAEVITEWPNAHLIGAATRLTPTKSDFKHGSPNQTFQIVHGSRTRFFSYDACPVHPINANNVAFAALCTVWLNNMWHETCGMLCYSDFMDQEAPGTGGIFAEGNKLHYFRQWAKKLNDAWEFCEDFFKGRMTYQLVDDWAVRRTRDLKASADKIWRDAVGEDSFFRSTSHINKDGDELGIILTYAYPNTEAILPEDVGTIAEKPTLNPEITINAEMLGLVSTRKSVYRITDGGDPELIGAFHDEITLQIPIQPWTVTLLRVVAEESDTAAQLAKVRYKRVSRSRVIFLPTMYAVDEEDLFDLLFGNRG